MVTDCCKWLDFGHLNLDIKVVEDDAKNPMMLRTIFVEESYHQALSISYRKCVLCIYILVRIAGGHNKHLCFFYASFMMSLRKCMVLII